MENLGTSSFLANLKELVNQRKDNYLIKKFSLSIIEEIETQKQSEENSLSRIITLKIKCLKCFSSEAVKKKVAEKTFFKPQFSYPSGSIEDLKFARSLVNTTIDSQHICNKLHVALEEEDQVVSSTNSSPPSSVLERDRGLISSIPDMSPEVANSFFEILVRNEEQDNILASTEIEHKGLNNITVFGSDIIRAELNYEIDNSIRYKFDYWMKKSLNYSTKKEEI